MDLEAEIKRLRGIIKAQEKRIASIYNEFKYLHNGEEPSMIESIYGVPVEEYADFLSHIMANSDEAAEEVMADRHRLKLEVFKLQELLDCPSRSCCGKHS